MPSKNKEVYLAYQRDYYYKNRETILQTQSEKVECDTCKCYIRKDGMRVHKQSRKHQKNIQKGI